MTMSNEEMQFNVSKSMRSCEILHRIADDYLFKQLEKLSMTERFARATRKSQIAFNNFLT